MGGSGVVSGGRLAGARKIYSTPRSVRSRLLPSRRRARRPTTRRLLGTPARLPVRVAAAPGGGGEVFEGVRWRAIE